MILYTAQYLYRNNQSKLIQSPKFTNSPYFAGLVQVGQAIEIEFNEFERIRLLKLAVEEKERKEREEQEARLKAIQIDESTRKMTPILLNLWNIWNLSLLRNLPGYLYLTEVVMNSN